MKTINLDSCKDINAVIESLDSPIIQSEVKNKEDVLLLKIIVEENFEMIG